MITLEVMKIIVNGQSQDTTQRSMSFEDAVRLAGKTGDRFTVAFKGAASQPADGNLAKGASISLKEGTAITVSAKS